MQKRGILWAGNVVEGNPRIRPVYRVHHSGSPTQGSQLFIIQVRKESEGTLGEFVGHCTRVTQTHRRPFSRARGGEERGDCGWVRRGGDAVKSSNVQGLISVSRSIESDHEMACGFLGRSD